MFKTISGAAQQYSIELPIQKGENNLISFFEVNIKTQASLIQLKHIQIG